MFCVQQLSSYDIHPHTQRAAEAAEAYDLMMSGKARFRCVLTTGN